MSIDITLVLLAIVIMGLTEIIKEVIGKDYKEFIPLIAILLGVLFVFSFQYLEVITTNILTGVVLGIVATGGFENIEKIKEIIDRLKKII